MAITYDPKHDLYELLGVRVDAAADVIKRARRRHMQSVHPDKGSGDTAKAAAINHACDILLNDENRTAYNAARVAYTVKKKKRPLHDRHGRKKTARSTREPKERPQSEPRRAPPQAAPNFDASAGIDMKKFMDDALKNAVRSVERNEYGLAFIWGILGVAAGLQQAQAPQAT